MPLPPKIITLLVALGIQSPQVNTPTNASPKTVHVNNRQPKPAKLAGNRAQKHPHTKLSQNR